MRVRSGAGGKAIPEFQAAIVVGKVLRFQANAAFSGVVFTAVQLQDLLCMATTTTTASRLAASMKIKKICLWGPMSSTLAPVTVSLEYASDTSAGFGTPNKLMSDTSMGTSHPAYVCGAPPKNSLPDMWHSRISASNLFTISGPVNTVIDVHLTYVLQNGETPVAVTSAVVGATVGTVYCRGLDALASAATVFPPLSYTTI